MIDYRDASYALDLGQLAQLFDSVHTTTMSRSSTPVATLEAQLTAPSALVMDLLAWVAARPRTYRETMDAWRTSCPRLPVWEDAVDHGLVAVLVGEVGGGAPSVSLTARGRALLEGRGP